MWGKWTGGLERFRRARPEPACLAIHIPPCKVFWQNPRYFLGEAAFKQWFKREFGFTKEEAEQKWANDSAPSSGVPQKVIEGTLKVMVKGHHAVVEEQGLDTGFRTLPQLQLRGNLEIVSLL